jgi:hypothetical protein
MESITVIVDKITTKITTVTTRNAKQFDAVQWVSRSIQIDDWKRQIIQKVAFSNTCPDTMNRNVDGTLSTHS